MEKETGKNSVTSKEPKDSVWGKLLRVLRLFLYVAISFLVLTSQDDQSTWALFSYALGSVWILSLLLTVFIDNTPLGKVFAFIEVFVAITILWGALPLSFDRFSMMVVVVVYNIGYLVGRALKTES